MLNITIRDKIRNTRNQETNPSKGYHGKDQRSFRNGDGQAI